MYQQPDPRGSKTPAVFFQPSTYHTNGVQTAPDRKRSGGKQRQSSGEPAQRPATSQQPFRPHSTVQQYHATVSGAAFGSSGRHSAQPAFNRSQPLPNIKAHQQQYSARPVTSHASRPYTPFSPPTAVNYRAWSASTQLNPAQSVPTAAPSPAVIARAQLIDSERKLVFGYLSSPNCHLFNQCVEPISLTENDLDTLLSLSSGSYHALRYLAMLDQQHEKYRAIDELIQSVRELHQAANDEKMAIVEYLQSAECQLLCADIQLSVNDVDRLYYETNAYKQTLQHLQTLNTAITEQVQPQYVAFHELLHAVKECHAEWLLEHSKSPRRLRSPQQPTRPQQNIAASDSSKRTTAPPLAIPTDKALHVEEEKHEEKAVPFAAPTQQAPNPKSPKQQQMHRIMMNTTKRDSERQQLLEYLTSHTCQLFSEVEEVIATAQQLDEMIQLTSGRVDQCVETLSELDRVHHMKATSMQDLIQQVHTHLQQQQHQRTLNHNKLLEYLTNPQCTLFSDGEIRATASELDQLIVLTPSHSVEATLLWLHNIEKDPQWKFGSIQHLIGHMRMYPMVLPTAATSPSTDESSHANNSATAQSSASHSAEFSALQLWLLSSECMLFSESEDDSIGKWTKREVETLLHTVPTEYTLQLCKHMNLHTYRYNDMTALVAAVTQSYSKLQRLQAEALQLLNTEQCTLLLPLRQQQYNQSRPVTNAAEVNEMVLRAGCTLDTLIHLDKLQRNGMKYRTVEALTLALRQQYESSYTAFTQWLKLVQPTEADRVRARAYLQSPPCRLLCDLPPDAMESVTDRQLNRYVHLCEGGQRLLGYFHQLNYSNVQFTSYNSSCAGVVEDLYNALKQAVEQSSEHIEQLYTLISSKAQQLFSPPLTTQPTKQQIQSLYYACGALCHTHQYVTAAVEHGQTFASVHDMQLCFDSTHAAMEQLVYERVLYKLERPSQWFTTEETRTAALTQQQKREIIQRYLHDPNSQLFPPLPDGTTDLQATTLSDGELAELLALCQNHCDELVVQLMYISSHTTHSMRSTTTNTSAPTSEYTLQPIFVFKDLLNNVEMLVQQSRQQAVTILQSLQTHSQQLFGSDNNVMQLSSVMLTPDDICRWMTQTRSGLLISQHLQAIYSAQPQQTYAGYKELVHAVNDLHSQYTRCQQEQHHILQFYINRDAVQQMFYHPFPCTVNDIHQLMTICSTTPSALYYIQRLQQQYRQFDDWRHFMHALRNIIASEFRIDLQHYLLHSDCKLLSGIRNNQDFEPEPLVEKLSEYGSAVMIHVQALNSNGNTYETAQELVAAVADSVMKVNSLTHNRYISLMTHMLSTEFLLFASVPIARRLPVSDVTQVLDSCGQSVTTAILLLDQLQQQQQKYKHAAEIVQQIQQVAPQWLSGRTLLLSFLTSTDCTLFSDPKRLISRVDNSKLSLEDMDQLTRRTVNAEKSLKFLQQLAAADKCYSSLQELAEDVEQLYNGELEQQTKQQQEQEAEEQRRKAAAEEEAQLTMQNPVSTTSEAADEPTPAAVVPALAAEQPPTAAAATTVEYSAPVPQPEIQTSAPEPTTETRHRLTTRLASFDSALMDLTLNQGTAAAATAATHAQSTDSVSVEPVNTPVVAESSQSSAVAEPSPAIALAAAAKPAAAEDSSKQAKPAVESPAHAASTADDVNHVAASSSTEHQLPSEHAAQSAAATIASAPVVAATQSSPASAAVVGAEFTSPSITTPSTAEPAKTAPPAIEVVGPTVDAASAPVAVQVTEPTAAPAAPHASDTSLPDHTTTPKDLAAATTPALTTSLSAESSNTMAVPVTPTSSQPGAMKSHISPSARARLESQPAAEQRLAEAVADSMSVALPAEQHQGELADRYHQGIASERNIIRRSMEVDAMERERMRLAIEVDRQQRRTTGNALTVDMTTAAPAKVAVTAAPEGQPTPSAEPAASSSVAPVDITHTAAAPSAAPSASMASSTETSAAHATATQPPAQAGPAASTSSPVPADTAASHATASHASAEPVPASKPSSLPVVPTTGSVAAPPVTQTSAGAPSVPAPVAQPEVTAAPAAAHTAAPPATTAASSASEDARNTLVAYLGECSLFSEVKDALQVEVEELDALIIQCSTAEHLVTLLKQLDARQQKFSSLKELHPALTSLLQHGVAPTAAHVSEADRNTFIAYLGDCGLFSQSDQLSVTEDDIDAVIVAGGGIQQTLQRCQQLDAQQHKFANLHDLQAAVRDSAGAETSEQDRNKLVAYLGDCNIFSTANELAVNVEELDALIHAARGVDTLINLLQQLDHTGLQLSAFNQLLPVVQQHMQPAASYSEEERNIIVEYLGNDECHLFDAVTDNLQVSMDDIDHLIGLCGGSGKAVVEKMKQLSANHVQLTSFAQLLPEMQKLLGVSGAPHTTGSSAHSSEQEQQILVGYLSSDACNLFSNSPEGLSVDEDEISALLELGQGGQPTVEHLQRFDAVGRQFRAFSELLPALRAALESGTYLADEQSGAIVTYLQDESTGLFSESDGLSLEPSDLDQLVILGGGSVERALAACKQLDQKGKRFRQFSELLPEVKATLLWNPAK